LEAQISRSPLLSGTTDGTVKNNILLLNDIVKMRFFWTTALLYAVSFFGTAEGFSELVDAQSCLNFTIRREWRRISDDEKTAFLSAVGCLMEAPSDNPEVSHSQFEDLVQLHQNVASLVHWVGHFLPWNRYFLNLFETKLRGVCGYHGGVPWWDEQLDAGHFETAPMFTAQWFGTAVREPNDSSGCVTDGVS
jgi:hypothetical protein